MIRLAATPLPFLFLVACSDVLAPPLLGRRDVAPPTTGAIAVTVCPDTLLVPDQSLACYAAWRQLGAR